TLQNITLQSLLQGGVAPSLTILDAGALGFSPTPLDQKASQRQSNYGSTIQATLNPAGNGLMLTGMQTFSVQAQCCAATAADLGLPVPSKGSPLNGTNINPAVLNGQNLNVLLLKLRGQDVNPIADQNTLLTDLNNGAGVSFQGDTGSDLEIVTGDKTVI